MIHVKAIYAVVTTTLETGQMKIEEAIKQLEDTINKARTPYEEIDAAKKRLKELRALQALDRALPENNGLRQVQFNGALLDYLFAKEGLDR